MKCMYLLLFLLNINDIKYTIKTHQDFKFMYVVGLLLLLCCWLYCFFLTVFLSHLSSGGGARCAGDTRGEYLLHSEGQE